MLRNAQWVAQATGGTLIGEPSIPFSAVVTDSREVTPGAVYIARVGESSDGHDYIPAACDMGASIIVCERRTEGLRIPQIIVEDSTLALGAMAREHIGELRLQGKITVIGLTGSAGKTTTKDLLAQLLSKIAPTVAPRLSFNNEVGLPLTVLEAQETTRFLVLEMGASGPGHLRYLTDIVAPDIAIELMVGHAHLGGFGSVKGVADAKQELIEGLRPGGLSILNADDPYVRSMAHAASGPVRYFSVSDDPIASYTVENLHLTGVEQASFTLIRRHSDGEEKADVTLKLVGAHHVSNALAAASVCCEVGMPLADVAAGLSQARALSPHRMALHHLVLNGHDVTLIDDSYNANSDSMAASLRTLAAVHDGTLSIAVLGEMLELGDASEEIHREVGQWARDAGVSALVALGQEARPYCEPCEGHLHTTHVANWEEALGATLKLIDASSVVLVKGSNGSGAWRVADALIERGQVS